MTMNYSYLLVLTIILMLGFIHAACRRSPGKDGLHWMKFGLLAFTSTLVLAGIAFRLQSPIFPLLVRLMLLAWTGTIIYVLIKGKHNRTMLTLGLLVIGGTPALSLFYTGGTSRFLNDVDHFFAKVISDEVDQIPIDSVESPSKEFSDTNTIGNESDLAKEKGRLTFSDGLRAAYVFLSVFFLSSYVGHIWRIRFVERVGVGNSPSFEGEDLEKVIHVATIVFSGWVVLVVFGGNALGVTIITGLGGLAVSVAFQDILKNLVAGMILLWDKTIKKQDVISLDGINCGVIKDITMRYLVIIDRHDISTLVPHTQILQGKLQNWSRDHEYVGLKLNLGIAYNSDVEVAIDIMKTVGYHVNRVLTNPAPRPLLMNYGESSIDFQLRFKISDPQNGIRNVMSEVYIYLLTEFKKADIEIPYPRRDIKVIPHNEAKPEHLSNVLL